MLKLFIFLPSRGQQLVPLKVAQLVLSEPDMVNPNWVTIAMQTMAMSPTRSAYSVSAAPPSSLRTSFSSLNTFIPKLPSPLKRALVKLRVPRPPSFRINKHYCSAQDIACQYSVN
jgi:hypothetical protein